MTICNQELERNKGIRFRDIMVVSPATIVSPRKDLSCTLINPRQKGVYPEKCNPIGIYYVHER